jgi:hypothetical protein
LFVLCLQILWRFGLLWCRVLPLIFLLLQYPCTAALLLVLNWEPPTSLSCIPLPLEAAWAWVVVSVSMWSVDIAATTTLLLSSLAAAAAASRYGRCLRCANAVLWLLQRWVQFLGWLSCSCRLPAAKAVLPTLSPDQPQGAKTWAENHIFAKMPMEALLESLGQVALQIVVYVTRPNSRQQPLLFFLFSTTLSVVSSAKALAHGARAVVHVGMTWRQYFRQLLQLQGGYRMQTAAPEDGPHHGARIMAAPDDLTIDFPASSNVMRRVVYLQAMLAKHYKQCLVRAETPDHWDLKIANLHAENPSQSRHDPPLAAQLKLAEALRTPYQLQHLAGMWKLELPDIDMKGIAQ